jgi:hypothetical protein
MLDTQDIAPPSHDLRRVTCCAVKRPQASATGFVGQTAHENRGIASGTYLACYFLVGLVGSAVLGQLVEEGGGAVSPFFEVARQIGVGSTLSE